MLESIMEVKYQGKIIQVIHKPTDVGNGKIINFEIARRAPGVRLIFIRQDKQGDQEILLSKEFRYELDDYDYRLPGGKVFDKLEEYLAALERDEDIATHAFNAAEREAKEECGLVPHNPKLIKISKNGATVEWDLYYFEISDFAVLKKRPGARRWRRYRS